MELQRTYVGDIIEVANRLTEELERNEVLS